MNGPESEAKKVVKEMQEKAKVEDNEGWEKVAKADERDSDGVEIEDSGNTTTAKGADDDSGLSKRVTRSAKKEELLEALE